MLCQYLLIFYMDRRHGCVTREKHMKTGSEKAEQVLVCVEEDAYVQVVFRCSQEVCALCVVGRSAVEFRHTPAVQPALPVVLLSMQEKALSIVACRQ